MANDEHVAKLREGVTAWNAWREAEPYTRPDLIGADLIGADLIGADLSRAHLSDASLSDASLSRAQLIGADLSRAHLIGADLSDADLSGANLSGSDLSGANLSDANLSGANLSGADLIDANLSDANLSDAFLIETVFGNVDLSAAVGLDTCNHFGPCTIDHRTLARSGPLPLAFLRGCGLPDDLINYLPSLLGRPFEFYSCFISYSSKDQEFAERLYADLQAKGVRCWYAPQDLRIGDRFQDTIDQAVRVRDKLLVILSENSLTSEWVEDEVNAAVSEERRDGQRRTVLFPVRIDDAIDKAELAWARRIKETRHIGDFSNWKDHDAYQEAFQRLLRDLRAEPPAQEE